MLSQRLIASVSIRRRGAGRVLIYVKRSWRSPINLGAIRRSASLPATKPVASRPRCGSPAIIERWNITGAMAAISD